MDVRLVFNQYTYGIRSNLLQQNLSLPTGVLNNKYYDSYLIILLKISFDIFQNILRSFNKDNLLMKRNCALFVSLHLYGNKLDPIDLYNRS